MFAEVESFLQEDHRDPSLLAKGQSLSPETETFVFSELKQKRTSVSTQWCSPGSAQGQAAGEEDTFPRPETKCSHHPVCSQGMPPLPLAPAARSLLFPRGSAAEELCAGIAEIWAASAAWKREEKLFPRSRRRWRGARGKTSSGCTLEGAKVDCEDKN